MDVKDEFEFKEELAKKRKDIKTFDDLVEYLKYVEEVRNCGYGEAPRAIAQAALAVSYYFSDVFGITGFQAGCTMWDFIQGWCKTGNECGLRLVDFDDMLYPQYAHKYEKTITPGVWNKLQEKAKENLKNCEGWTHPDVVEHWKSIARGVIPFGYSLSRD